MELNDMEIKVMEDFPLFTNIKVTRNELDENFQYLLTVLMNDKSFYKLMVLSDRGRRKRLLSTSFEINGKYVSFKFNSLADTYPLLNTLYN